MTEDEVLQEKLNNFLLSVNPSEKTIGLAWCDISTGKFILNEISYEQLSDEFARINPSEILVPDERCDKLVISQEGSMTVEEVIKIHNISLTRRPCWFFDNENGERVLKDYLGVESLQGYGCENLKIALGAAGALLKYLEDTQKCALKNFDKVEVYNSNETMFLDRATRLCLEIQKTMREENKQGALISVLDKTCTSMGGRLLSSWLSAPLKSVEKIKSRQDGIKELLDSLLNMNKIRENLSMVQDIERLSSRIAYQRANARDVLALKNSLKIVPELKKILENFNSAILNVIKEELV